jgi:hypothetical protein
MLKKKELMCIRDNQPLAALAEKWSSNHSETPGDSATAAAATIDAQRLSPLITTGSIER